MPLRPDAAYKLLFSTREIVRDLVTGFIGEPWVAQLDLDTLEKLPTNFVDRRLRQRLTDVVWRVRTGDRSWAYLYLLIEFQSRNDPWMAVRVMAYVALLWQDLLRHDRALRRTRTLPPVLPVVIYNGLRPWRAATDVGELLPKLPTGLAGYVPRMKYLLLDQSRFSEEPLRPMRNLMAAVIRLDRPAQDPAFLDAVAELRNLVAGSPELERVFSDWLQALFAESPELIEAGALDFQEREMGLRDNIAMWKREATEQGRREGRQEGQRAGLQEGQAQLLQTLLAQRFGPLPPDLINHLRAAAPEQLSNWGLRVLSARTLEEVFAN